MASHLPLTIPRHADGGSERRHQGWCSVDWSGVALCGDGSAEVAGCCASIAGHWNVVSAHRNSREATFQPSAALRELRGHARLRLQTDDTLSSLRSRGERYRGRIRADACCPQRSSCLLDGGTSGGVLTCISGSALPHRRDRRWCIRVWDCSVRDRRNAVESAVSSEGKRNKE